VDSLLADSPPAPPEQADERQSPPPEGPPGAPAPAPTCASCGQAMAPGQDWCLQCGAAGRGSVASAAWRPTAGILAVTAALVLGAAAAGVAALSKKAPRAPVVTTTVAQVAGPAAGTPPVGTPTTPSTGAAGLTPPPKIPLKAATPAPATRTPTATTPATTRKTTEKATEKTSREEPSTSNTGGSGGEGEPEAILLDTNAAQTYNPYAYPAAGFGDPSLAIDGDTSTGWTAQVNPSAAPRMAEGLLVDLKTAQRISLVKLVTSTPGIVVQIYGANGHTVPGSITGKAWVPLSHQQTIKKRNAKFTLRHQKQAYRFVAVWISRAGESSIGTAQAPGHVTIDEVELFPAK